MKTSNFIGQSFWSFFSTLPEWRRRKELLNVENGIATLLVTNEDTNEQYKVVCKCESHNIRTYCFSTGFYFTFNEIISITKE